jgi:cytoskeleton protein RodZ
MSTPESVGEFFRQVRETKGLTLEDVATKTRIHFDFLIALEENNFTKLPDQVFAKGFVRSYARSLGLDEEDAIRRFVQSAGPFYDKQAERELLRLKEAEDERRKKANRKAVAAGTGVALLALILLLTREQSTAPPPRTAADAPIPPVASKSVPQKAPPAAKSAEPGPKPAEPAVSASPVLPVPNQEPIPPLAAVPSEPLPTVAVGGMPAGEGPLALDLEATELSWIVIQIDGGSPQEALMRPGERLRWKGSEKFLLTLGNAGGVRVELNGKAQGPFGPSGKVVRDIVIKK